MADKVVIMFKRIPVIIGFIMILVGIVLVFALPYLLIPVFTETSTDVKADYDTGVGKFASYQELGDFTLSGEITEEVVDKEDNIFKYRVDDSIFTVNSKSDLGEEGDFLLIKVRVAQDKETNEDYLLAIELRTQIIYNIPGFVVFVIGVTLFLIGLLRKTPEERASKEKAIARKKALDKELDILERDLQFSYGGPPGGQPGMMPPGGIPPGQPPQQPPMGGAPPAQPMAGAPPQAPAPVAPRPPVAPGARPPAAGAPPQAAAPPMPAAAPGQAPAPAPAPAPAQAPQQQIRKPQ